jgi:1,4-dihydroxy-2-naphthoate polyprenyltransferase
MTVAALPAPRSLGAWWLAARPRTLPVAVAPVVVGGAAVFRDAHFNSIAWMCALFGAIFIQIGTNFANDVFDFEKGTDNETRIGPTRAVQAGLLTPSAMRAGMIAAFALAVAIGVYLTWIGGAPIVAIGIASILSGIAYTGGPYPLGYNGLGDVFVFVFFGFVAVCGTTWVTAHAIPNAAILSSAGVGALATAVLVVNNTRDAATDVRTGKRTLVVRFGRGFGVGLYRALFLIAALVPVGLAVLQLGSLPILVGASMMSVVLLVRFGNLLSREREGELLNRLLANTAKALVIYAALLAVALAS